MAKNCKHFGFAATYLYMKYKTKQRKAVLCWALTQ